MGTPTTARYAEKRGLKGRWRHASRRKKIMALAVVMVLVGTAAIAAVLFFRAPITGQVTVPESPVIRWATTTPTVTAKQGEINCQVSRTSTDNGTLTITISEAWPTNWCEVRASAYRVSGTTDVQVQDLVLNGSVEVGFKAGANGCGRTVSSGTSGFPVEFRITIPEDATAGTTTFPADAGLLTVLPSEFVDADCPKVGT